MGGSGWRTEVSGKRMEHMVRVASIYRVKKMKFYISSGANIRMFDISPSACQASKLYCDIQRNRA